MLNFQETDVKEFLSAYWQKKPLVIRNALPGFVAAISGDELAGLAMEDEIESRMVFETPAHAPYWRLQRGPFTEEDFASLPDTHWTLLVQGVDRFVPEVAALLDNFNFLPAWRVDDVMISYAVNQGGVGPHYDNYDVFLYQAQGRRKWLLTTQECVPENYHTDVDLRIMKRFQVEEEIILEEGDMLYLPPHVGHHGTSLSKDCMTYSFGYRSYQTQELWDSLGEHMAMQQMPPVLYRDPDWNCLNSSAEIPEQAWQQAKKSLQRILDDEQLLKHWFAAFATSLDQQAETLLPMEADDADTLTVFCDELFASAGIARNPLCRFAYLSEPELTLYVNGCAWCVEQVSPELVRRLANQRSMSLDELLPFVSKDGKKAANLAFLYELWKLQWLELQMLEQI
ncbi:JmjC domain-containing protein [Legionella sp. CNM-4043-24]|uniref:JmjC domain-containing protein n=1 Tax=Legionella sp. CNM-4043-24 TaxID=3421646 RepID=UPI00403B17F8